MNNLIFFNVNKKIVFLLMIAFYSVPMRNVSPIRAGNDSGNTYCLNGNLNVGTNISIPNEATLIIQTGQLQSVSIQVSGVLEIGDGASVRSTGTVTVGFNSQKDSKSN
jgi:hypothetical protein